MTSAASRDLPCPKTAYTDEDSGDKGEATSTIHFPVDMPDLLSDSAYDEMVDIGVAEEDPFSDYLALFSAQADQTLLNDTTGDLNSIYLPFLQQVTPLPGVDANDERAGSSSNNSGSSYDGIGQPLDPSSPISSRSPHGSSSRKPQKQIVPLRRQPRKQNRSCDQCRSMKRACDLLPSIVIEEQKPLTACSTCNLRGVECTVAWLEGRQSEQHARKRARLNPSTVEADNPSQNSAKTGKNPTADALLQEMTTSVSMNEVILARQFNAHETCSQQFNLYVDVFDLPLSDCLSQGTMPPHYSLGVAALAPLSHSAHLSVYLDQANSWIRSCWEMKTAPWASAADTPPIFGTVSILDSLFQQRGAQSFRPSMAARDESITETYKWVAMATAAQFKLGQGERVSMSHSRARDIFSAIWRKAKQMVFENIAAISSFRLALSLLLFGIILPPVPDENSSAFEEDASFALGEGIRRLQLLCARARAALMLTEDGVIEAHSTETCNAAKFKYFPPDVRDNVLELLGAVEWLTTITNSITIATSRGRICAFHPNNSELDSGNMRCTDTASQRPDTENPLIAQQPQQVLEDSIVTRAKADPQTVTAVWRKGAPNERLLNAVKRSGSLEILMWKSLALLTLVVESTNLGDAEYEEIQLRYTATLTLIDLWRSTFGRFDRSSPFGLQELRPDIRRGMYYCSNDGDLAVLEFYDIVRGLETRLAEQQQQPLTPAKERLCTALRSTSDRRKEQRLVSAEQVSIIASTFRGISSPGFQGHSGLKTYILDIAAHPVSFEPSSKDARHI